VYDCLIGDLLTHIIGSCRRHHPGSKYP